MFKFLAGVATGWIASRSLHSPDESPFKAPTFEEMAVLMNRAKQLTEYISTKMKDIEEKPPNDSPTC